LAIGSGYGCIRYLELVALDIGACWQLATIETGQASLGRQPTSAASLERAPAPAARRPPPGGMRRRIIFEMEYGPAPRYIFLFYFQ